MKPAREARSGEVPDEREAQVDFGAGAPIAGPDGKRRRTHVFRIVLSHSRKAYSEATYRQTTDDFLRCLENAFEQFGGVPETLVIDNLKAAVKHPDWFDPELVPKVAAFAAHYGPAILPTRPYTPRHKGKVERGINYVQENALKGRTFETLGRQNEHLAQWEASRRSISAAACGCGGTRGWSAFSTIAWNRSRCTSAMSWAASARSASIWWWRRSPASSAARRGC